ncbi:hypothetical protein CK500_00100 [Halorubrum salipaludis]|uniref:Uncharacterized protein n=1 Tax=Halorubrum salipaludis TaxID=2032630 RepID=A0A2A2FI06_9EURY|nr:hypothetical protein [Halorubrum salipaludis]PAU85111.1 hypothetical protein CK500_00100 [Halorubrum salipaludis]
MGRPVVPRRGRAGHREVVAVSRREATAGDGDEADPIDADSLDASDRERDARPPTLAVVGSLVAGAVAALAALLAAPIGGALVGLAALGLLAGSLRRSHRLLSWAAGIGAVGIAVAGYRGGAVEPLLAAGVALALAWDLADHGVSLGEQVGREARTRRNVAVHAGTNLLAGGLSIAVVYGAYLAAAGSQPVAALALLLFGAVALASAVR